MRAHRPDLGATELLHMGCGVRFTKLFVNQGVAIKRYVGIAVFAEMIDFLRQNVGDPRFEYHHIDVRNDKDNADGAPFTETIALPVDGQTFDLICLFSVFTPPRTTAGPCSISCADTSGRTGGSLHALHQRTDARWVTGLIDSWTSSLGDQADVLAADVAARVAAGLPEQEPFVELDPTRSLNWAVYTRDYAHESIDGTGWRVVSVSDPTSTSSTTSCVRVSDPALERGRERDPNCDA